MSTDTTETTESDRTSSDRRRLFGYGFAVVVAVTALSAGAGYTLETWRGLEETTILAMPVAVSPGAFALYGAVVSATFLITLALVFYTVSMLEDEGGVDLE